MLITIFTPTYNRAYTLKRLYESIKMQKGNAFEWVVVDDGSSDDTPSLVEEWIEDRSKNFDIRYFRQKNAGKHAAWNKGLEEARGDVFFPVDSDDYLTENALEHIEEMIGTVSEHDKIIAVSGVCSFPGEQLTGGVIGEIGSGYIDYLSIDRRSKGISGDLAEAFFTDKLRSYPFPVFEDERFVPEALIFNRFSNDGFMIRGFAYPLYHCEYLPDGYTRNVNKLLVTNWKGYSLYVKELIASPTSIKAKMVPLCGFIYRWIIKTLRLIH